MIQILKTWILLLKLLTINFPIYPKFLFLKSQALTEAFSSS